MRIDHLSIWTYQLEELRAFYETYFQAQSGPKYTNPTHGYESYFLTFPDQGARLEIMQMAGIPISRDDPFTQFTGLIHFAISVGSKERVDEFTNRFEADGIRIIGYPRWTGDHYYESVILDPDGNRVEITI